MRIYNTSSTNIDIPSQMKSSFLYILYIHLHLILHYHPTPINPLLPNVPQRERLVKILILI